MKQYCELEGLAEPRCVDAVQLEDARGIWDDTKWVVREQRPPAGTPGAARGGRPILIAYSRPHEILKLPLLRRHLDKWEEILDE